MNKQGLVLSGRNGNYSVETENGTVLCRSAAKITKSDKKLQAGDRVVFSDNGDGTGFITELLPRKNWLVRPPVSNVDLLCIVVAPKEPDPFLYNIDLLTVLAQKAGIEILLLITKCDIASVSYLEDIYQKTPFRVISTSAVTGVGVEEAKKAISGRICVLCGASGVGKSSLLNAMFPFLNAKTGILSQKISRGKNTTRVTELFSLGDGTYLADSPGFSAIETEQYFVIESKELHTLFPEFFEFSDQCRYADCTHTKETECAIADAADKGLVSPSRLDSYRKLYQELRNINRYK